LLAWTGIAIAERYFSDNNDLRGLALALVPPDAEILLENSSECSRSGWERVFTVRDSCHEIRFSLPSVAGRPGEALARAESSRWTVTAEHSANGFDLTRSGYRGYVRFRDPTDIQTCIASAPQTPGFCYHAVSVLEAE
jgi:hypothetical protein